MAKSRHRTLPSVLIIDDSDEDGAAAALSLRGRVRPKVCSPNAVTYSDLKAANLVLVDQKLDDWIERDQQSTPSLMPKNGLALVATLRSNLEQTSSRTPTAFALRSGKLSDLSGNFQVKGREHALAKLYDLEWVFAKSGSSVEFADQVTCLATAARSLPHPWPVLDRRRTALSKLLGLSRKAGWTLSALEDLDHASPPEDMSSETSRGLAVLRWLLQDIFPYPGLLIETRYLAARLFMNPDALSGALEGPKTTALKMALTEFEYSGTLAGFLGIRWWRAGIDHWLWKRTKGNPFHKDMVVQSLKKLVKQEGAFSSLKQPVVRVDDQFRPTNELIELSDAVQITPDNWPKSADAAWAPALEVAKDHVLKARVDARDRDRVEE